MKNLYLICIFSFITGTLQAQTEITWKQLADVTFKPQYFKEIDMKVLVPTFGASIKDLEGKNVAITGYLIPVDPSFQTVVLSRNPYASCFFCGGAGPETIVELWLSPNEKRRFRMDERLTFSGILQLNNNDLQHCNYILT